MTGVRHPRKETKDNEQNQRWMTLTEDVYLADVLTLGNGEMLCTSVVTFLMVLAVVGVCKEPRLPVCEGDLPFPYALPGSALTAAVLPSDVGASILNATRLAKVRHAARVLLCH